MLQQSLLFRLEQLRPATAIDASVLLPIIDAYEALLQFEGEHGLRTFLPPNQQDDMLFESHQLSGRTIYLLGENHYNPSSLQKLRLLIQELNGISCADILLCTETASFNASFSVKLRIALQDHSVVLQASAMYFFSSIAEKIGIQTCFPVVNIHTISVLEELHRQMKDDFSWLELSHIIAFFVSILVKDAMNNTIQDPYQFTASVLCDYVGLLSFDQQTAIDGYTFLQRNSSYYDALSQSNLCARMRALSAQQTYSNMTAIIEDHPRTTHIICIAGRNHIPSICEGLGIASS